MGIFNEQWQEQPQIFSSLVKMRTLSLSLRVTGDDDDDDDIEELNEAVDDDEQSFHQGPGAVADPNIVRWQVKMWMTILARG